MSRTRGALQSLRTYDMYAAYSIVTLMKSTHCKRCRTTAYVGPKRVTMKLNVLALAVVLAMLGASSNAALADSIVLRSSSGGTYDYGLSVDSKTTFSAGQTIDLTGLGGITDLSLNGVFDGPFSATFTSSTVMLTAAVKTTFLPGSKNSPAIYDLFAITSESSSSGNVAFALQSNLGTTSGSVSGPIAATTPEPSSLVLLFSGFAVVFLSVKGRVGSGT